VTDEPDGTLDRSDAADEVRRAIGLPPAPPEEQLPSGSWWAQYQVAEGAVLRYLRALDAMPVDAPDRGRVAGEREYAVSQLALVGALCARAWKTRAIGPRQTRRERRRISRMRSKQRKIGFHLGEVVRALERFADSAAATAFGYALDAPAEAAPPPDALELEHALEALSAALDELNAANRESLDP
jgi:hypothetical protein